MQRNTKRIRHAKQTAQAGIPARSLNIGDVGPGKLAHVGEDLLRPAFALARAGYAGRQAASDFGFRLGFHEGVPNQVK